MGERKLKKLDTSTITLDEVLTIKQAARVYNYTTSWIYKLISNEIIDQYILGDDDDGPKVILKKEFEDYIEQNARKKEGAAPTNASR